MYDAQAKNTPMCIRLLDVFLERLQTVNQIVNYLKTNDIVEDSGYKARLGTETALLKVYNDITSNIDQGFLVLLVLSAAL